MFKRVELKFGTLDENEVVWLSVVEFSVDWVVVKTKVGWIVEENVPVLEVWEGWVVWTIIEVEVDSVAKVVWTVEVADEVVAIGEIELAKVVVLKEKFAGWEMIFVEFETICVIKGCVLVVILVDSLLNVVKSVDE